MYQYLSALPPRWIPNLFFAISTSSTPIKAIPTSHLDHGDRLLSCFCALFILAPSQTWNPTGLSSIFLKCQLDVTPRYKSIQGLLQNCTMTHRTCPPLYLPFHSLTNMHTHTDLCPLLEDTEACSCPRDFALTTPSATNVLPSALCTTALPTTPSLTSNV